MQHVFHSFGEKILLISCHSSTAGTSIARVLERVETLLQRRNGDAPNERGSCRRNGATNLNNTGNGNARRSVADAQRVHNMAGRRGSDPCYPRS
jgi:hypothetical protein